MDLTDKYDLYGYCPKCGAPGKMRERRLNGNDICQNGHTYPSASAVKPPPRPKPKEAQ